MLHNVTKTRSTLHNATAINWSQTNSSWTLWHEQEHLCTFGKCVCMCECVCVYEWAPACLCVCVCACDVCIYLCSTTWLLLVGFVWCAYIHTNIHAHTHTDVRTNVPYVFTGSNLTFLQDAQRPRLPSITCCIVRWARLVIVTLLYFDSDSDSDFGCGYDFGNCLRLRLRVVTSTSRQLQLPYFFFIIIRFLSYLCVCACVCVFGWLIFWMKFCAVSCFYSGSLTARAHLNFLLCHCHLTHLLALSLSPGLTFPLAHADNLSTVGSPVFSSWVLHSTNTFPLLDGTGAGTWPTTTTLPFITTVSRDRSFT